MGIILVFLENILYGKQTDNLLRSGDFGTLEKIYHVFFNGCSLFHVTTQLYVASSSSSSAASVAVLVSVIMIMHGGDKSCMTLTDLGLYNQKIGWQPELCISRL
jgi:hypothetical protein